VPFGVKELERVEQWPYTETSMIFKDRVSRYDQTSITRLRRTGALLAAQTTASEFGGINCTSTQLHGTTRNPWDFSRTPGGSSGGTAAAVSGGLLPIATGSDGGGSIRIPAAFSGLFGLKATYGRIPKGPGASATPLTAVLGCLTRSVRDTARFFDACCGFDQRDPLSLPRAGNWEVELGTHDLSGRTVAILPDLETARVRAEVADLVAEFAHRLARAAGLKIVDVTPSAAAAGPMGHVGSGRIRRRPRRRLPRPDRGTVARDALRPGGGERALHPGQGRRHRVVPPPIEESMADLFEAADFVMASSNPNVAFAAQGPPPSTIPGADLIRELGFSRAIMNNAALTAPSNLNGSPAMSLPAGLVDGLPVGLQVLAGHHHEQLLLDLALVAERELPWPKVAPGSPHERPSSAT